jgi:hypothetical protein
MLLQKYVVPVAVAAAAAVLSFPLACSSKSSALVGDDSSDGGEEGSTSSSGSSSGSSGSSSSGGFMQTDSGGMGTGVCKTGTYSGPFSCGFYFNQDAGTAAPVDGGAADGGLGQIMGNLSFVLTQSQSGELNQGLASGTFAISAGFFVTGMSTLSGTLDCNSGTFNGMLAGGTYSVFFGLFSGTFDGPLTSEYNGKTASFVNGGWSLTIPGEGYCQGQWNANYQGPGDAGTSDQ